MERLPLRLQQHLNKRFRLDSSDSIAIRFAPNLTAHRGKLLTNAGRGTPVHAGCFIRRREIVLESQLLLNRALLLYVLGHELFHFVWTRLGNPLRAQYAELLRSEVSHRARGEAGESSEVAKARWLSRPHSQALWINYICESFCDTASIRNAPQSLAARWWQRRQRWLQTARPSSGWRC